MIAALLSLAFLIPAHAGERPTSPVESLLFHQLSALQAIQPHLEAEALPRWLVLKRSTERAMETLRESPLGGGRVFKAHLSLVIRYRRSKTFFAENTADVTREYFDALVSSIERIARLMDVDSSIYLHITAETFEQVHRLLPQPSPLIESIADLISYALANGDGFETFRKAAPLCKKLLKVEHQEIRGLVLWYVDYASLKREVENAR